MFQGLVDSQNSMGPGGGDAWVCLGNECCEDITQETTFKLGDEEDFAGGKKKGPVKQKEAFWKEHWGV